MKAHQHWLLKMADRNHLRVIALFTLFVLTEAMYTAPQRAAKREMKSIVHEVLREMQNESICNHNKTTAVYTIGCLNELKNISDCELVSMFGTYFTEATDLDIQKFVTEKLQEISQYLQSFQQTCCTSEPQVKNCDAFNESDGDYEKLCKVVSLLELLTQWLSR